MKKKQNLETSNIFDRLFFTFNNKVVKIGANRQFKKDELFEVDKKLQFPINMEQIDTIFIKSNKNHSFMWKSFLFVKQEFMIALFLFLLSEAFGFSLPFLAQILIKWFKEEDEENLWGFWFSLMIFFSVLMRVFFHYHGIQQLYRIKVKVIYIFFGLVYNKLENVSLQFASFLNIGQITSALTVDIVRLELFYKAAYQLIVFPLIFTAFTILIIIYIGWVGIIASLLIIINVLFMIFLSKLNAKMAIPKLKFNDKRNKQVENALSGIKSIKFNNWERAILKMIQKTRKQEMDLLIFYHFNKNLINFFANFASHITSFVTLTIYIVIHDDLTIEKAFFIMTLVNLLGRPMKLFSFAIYNYFECQVVVGRMNHVIEFPNQTKEQNLQHNNEELEQGELSIEDGTFQYENEFMIQKMNNFIQATSGGQKKLELIDDSNIVQVLKQINIKVKPKEFIGIVGAIGAGKSSLLNAFLKSIIKVNGVVKKNGTVSYIPQESFLLNQTLKNNILFGQQYDKEKLKHIIKICQLVRDIKMLPGGLETEIGERGVNLSGGQKQRISIARTVYANTDIYLIDDCLSALDAHVGKKIFEQVFQNFLKNKTRILATHSLQYLPYLDRIIFLEDGVIECEGTYQYLIETNQKFKEYVQNTQKQNQDEDNKDITIDESFTLLSNQKSLNGTTQINNNIQVIEQRQTGKLTKNENIYKGVFDVNSFMKHLKNGNLIIFFISVFFILITQALRLLSDYFLAAWVQDNFEYSYKHYLISYVLINIGLLIAGILGCLIFAKFSIKAAFFTFKNLMSLLFRKVITFFDITPLGQLLNLTSSDTDKADILIFLFFYNVINNVLSFIILFIVMIINNFIVAPLVVLFMVVTLILFRRYLKCSIQMRRFELMAFSPLLSIMNEIYNGLKIIRGCNQVQFLKDKFIKDINFLVKASYTDRCLEVSEFFKIEIASSILLGLSFILLCFGKYYNWSFLVQDTSILALLASNIILFAIMFNFAMFFLGEFIKTLSSLQRIFRNVDDSMLENDYDKPQAPEDWPSQGQITAKNIQMRYRKNLPLILKGISFKINSKEKIGIVGRTGSGKSTLMLVLTRLIEMDINDDEHYIEFDDVKTFQIGLSYVRSSIKVIPQDPYLFKGTLKENIDPFQIFTDEQIIQSLKKALLWDSNLFRIESDDKEIEMDDFQKLNFKISNKGSNLSAGQKQLICIARALIKVPKILLIDEATSNIDPNTDALIQQIFRKEFSESTIITIAHRIDTIILYDRIFVMDQGNIIEDDTPWNLMNDKNSIFRELVFANGQEFYDKILYCTCDTMCLRCNIGKNQCQFCDLSENRIVEIDRCVILQYPNCLDYYPNGSCIQCDQGYYLQDKVCVKKTSDIEIDNCKIYISETVCSLCNEEYYLNDGKCEPVPEQIEGCQVYKDNSYQICDLCKPEYNLTRDQSICIKKPNVQNCLQFSFIKCNKCKTNFINNKNLYFKNFFDLSNTSKRQIFYERMEINKPLKVDTCERVEVENCKEYNSYNKCKVCNDNFFINKSICYAYPQEPILNCTTYEENGTKCILCEEGYNIVNNKCVSVTLILNCKFYFKGEVATTEDSLCAKCEAGFYLKDAQCQVRNKTIDNCLDYQATEEKCEECANGFILTTDSLSCLAQLDNCLIYTTSNEFTTKLSCDKCINGMTFQLNSGKCEDGLIQDCVVYTQNNQCSECTFKFYTDTQQCFPHDNIDNCLLYNYTKKNFCQQCNLDGLLFTQTTQCSVTQKIDQCVTYRKSTECGECDKGYYLQTLEDDPIFTNTCTKIDDSLNCWKLDGQQNCLECKEKTVLKDGKCEFKIDVQEGYCQKHNLNGILTYENFICQYCEYQTYPVNLNKYFACTHESNIKSVVQNCGKYDFNELSQNYSCVLCKEGYYLNQGVCEQVCGTTEDDIQTYPAAIVLDKTGISDNYTSYKIQSVDQCIQLQQNQIVNNCILYYPDIYFQNALKTQSDYLCIKCQGDSISIVKRKTTANLFTFDLDQTMEGPLLAYPGFNCITVSLDTILSENKIDNRVPNCDVYYNVKRKESLDLYGCLKCEFGYSGIITVSENDRYYGYLDKCDLMNDIESELDGKCDLSIIYQGYTLNRQQIDWNQVPLETYLSCYKCQNINEVEYRPFLFLHFEDTTSSYNSNYNSFQNLMTEIIPLQSYGFDENESIILMNESGGRNVRCMTLDPNNFRLTDDQFKILGNLDAVLSKKLCALFIVNVARKPMATESYLEYPSSLDNSSIYCGACIPGYTPSLQGKLQSNTDADVQTKIFLPYYVYQCQQIDHCLPGGNWVNFCEKCKEGYVWQWDNDLKTILYNRCQSSDIKFCISVDEQSACIACQKGYEIINNVCDKIIPPYCHQDETIYEKYFPANPQESFIGRNYLYLRKYPRGCNRCREGYVSQLQTDTSDLYHQFICSQSFYMKDIQITNESYFIPNCKNFYIADTLSSTLQCKICEFEFVISTDGYCFPQQDYQNCQTIKKVENQDNYECIECQAGYIFLLGKCVKGTIDKCIEYSFNQYSTSQTCQTCQDGYYSIGTECKIGKVQHCLKFNSEKNCKECIKNYYIFDIKDNQNLCIKIPEEFNCKTFNLTDLQDRKLQCSVCQQDYVLELLLTNEKSFCIQKDSIENCQKYEIEESFVESTFQCSECSLQFYLDYLNQICILRLNQDENCETYEIQNDLCKVCKQNFYLSNDKTKCIINPQGIKGCITYSNEETCTACNQHMYLSFNKCIEIPEDQRLSNCLYYNTLTSCSQCEPEYYVNNNDCSKSSAENCAIADSSTKCKTCPENFGFKKNEETLVLNCVEKTDKTCAISTDTFPFECS